jgi:hypothetical protein
VAVTREAAQPRNGLSRLARQETHVADGRAVQPLIPVDQSEVVATAIRPTGGVGVRRGLSNQNL